MAPDNYPEIIVTILNSLSNDILVAILVWTCTYGMFTLYFYQFSFLLIDISFYSFTQMKQFHLKHKYHIYHK
jgi:hypothetical protein